MDGLFFIKLENNEFLYGTQTCGSQVCVPAIGKGC